MAKTKQLKTINDLKPDPMNVNKGTERGAKVIDWSLGGRWTSKRGGGKKFVGAKKARAAKGDVIDVGTFRRGR